MNASSIDSSKSVRSFVAKNVYTLIKVAIAILFAIGAFLATRFCGLNLIGQITIPSVTFVATLIALLCQNNQRLLESQIQTYDAQIQEVTKQINKKTGEISQITPDSSLPSMYDAHMKQKKALDELSLQIESRIDSIPGYRVLATSLRTLLNEKDRLTTLREQALQKLHEL